MPSRVLHAIAFLFVGLIATNVVAGEDGARPNIVLILADDLGWSDLGCYGADLHETPHLDALARQGLRFTNAYAAAPVCTPTRAALMTGKHPARLHMTIWYEASQNPPQNRPLAPPVTVANLPHEESTLAEALQAAGYFTAHLGKWHLGDAAHYPETHGFDLNVGGTFWGAPSTFFFPYRGYWSTSKEYRYVPGLAWGREGEYLTDRLTDEALQVIERAGDRPFFLYLAYHTVHTPIEAKEAAVEHYRRKLAPELRHQNPTYAAMVHSLDENVGRILAKLNERKLADKTLVLFTSDNGGYINEYRGQTVTNNHPLRSGKGSLYEGGVRIPLIVRWPGVTPPGGVCEEPVVSMDLYPTVQEAAGLAANLDPSIDGLSLQRVLRDPQAKLDRKNLFFHYPHYYPTTTPVSAVRSGDWKLLEYFETGDVELYHLGSDLSESVNLANQAPEKAAELRDRLHAWREAVKAQTPTPNPRHPRN